jgi:ABC-type transport system involved in multi-copper enzyme maturation permease subunit
MTSWATIAGALRHLRAQPIALLAIIERELRVAARRPATYRIRFIAVLGALALLFWKLHSFTSQQGSLSQLGRSLFVTLAVLAFVYCLFAGVRTTSDCLSEEKREGTLGLLFLTDLKGGDVVLGKLTATSLNSLYGLLAIFPALAIPMTLGGVTLLEFASIIAILLNTLFFSLAMGVFVSSVSRNERKAASATVLAVLAPTLVPAALVYLVLVLSPTARNLPEMELIRNSLPTQAFNPLLSFVYVLLPPGIRDGFPPLPWWRGVSSFILDAAYALAHFVLPGRWYAALPKWTVLSPVLVNLFFVQVLSWAALFKAARIVPEVWKDRPESRVVVHWRDRWRLFSQGDSDARHKFRRALLNVNPFQWLSSRDRLKPHYAWFFLLAMVGVWYSRYLKEPDVMFDFFPLVPTLLIVHTFLKIWVAAECSQKLVEDQRSGALELLLSTPLTPGEIVEGQALALKRQFAWPFLALCVLELGAFSGHYSPVSILLVQAALLADALTLMRVSMWLSLSARSLNHVILLAVGLVLAAPMALFLVVLGVVERFPSPRNPEVFAAGPGGVVLAVLAWLTLWIGFHKTRSDLWKWMAASLACGTVLAGQIVYVAFSLFQQRRASPRWDIPFDQRLVLWFLVGLVANLFILGWVSPRLLGRFREAVLRRFERTAPIGPNIAARTLSARVRTPPQLFPKSS